MADRSLSLSRNGKNIYIRFPYDEALIAVVKTIRGSRWDPEERVWRCPIYSLGDVIRILEPEGFHISDLLREKLPAVEAQSLRRTKKKEAEKAAEKRLEMHKNGGSEIAFVPSANPRLTRKLKQLDAYIVITEPGYKGPVTAGLQIREENLLATLTEVGGPTCSDALLLELLRYAWHINDQAKDSSYSASRYRYMKKGYLLDELCRLATKQQRLIWGWKEDPNPPVNGAVWVLYFEYEGMQCSFHTFERGEGPDFPGAWNGKRSETFPLSSLIDATTATLFKATSPPPARTLRRRSRRHKRQSW